MLSDMVKRCPRLHGGEGSEEAVPGPSVFPSGEPGVSGDFWVPALEKEMATHSSVLAWRIPGTGEPGGLPSTGLHRVGHD